MSDVANARCRKLKIERRRQAILIDGKRRWSFGFLVENLCDQHSVVLDNVICDF
jgi:hypothetical protein